MMAAPLDKAEVAGAVDWERRYDHMQQHSGQHLLSAVLEELFKMPTLSFHMGAETSTIDVGEAASASPQQIERAEDRCAEIVAEARPVKVTFEDASADLALRKASDAQRNVANRVHRGNRPQRMRRHARPHHSRDRAGSDPQAGQDPGDHADRIRVWPAGVKSCAHGFSIVKQCRASALRARREGQSPHFCAR